MEPDGEPKAMTGAKPLARERLEQLYFQAETVKMINLRELLETERAGATDNRLAQTALKSIELQLRLLVELTRGGEDETLPAPVAEVWQAMLATRSLGPLLRRGSVREELLARVRAMAGERVSSGDAGRPDFGGEAGLESAPESEGELAGPIP